MKNFKILASIPKNLIIYRTKTLCHHIKHTSFYLWLKYGIIRLVLFNKLQSETQLLNHLSQHLSRCFNHPNHKKSLPF